MKKKFTFDPETFLRSSGFSEEQVQTVIHNVAIQELDEIVAPLWEKAKTAKYALEADTYMQVINTINERKKYHETNK